MRVHLKSFAQIFAAHLCGAIPERTDRNMPHPTLAIAALLLLAIGTPLAAQSPAAKSTTPWDTHSDTWVGVDALGRPLPANSDVGPPRANRTLGIFYFLTADHTPDGPYDNTKILKAHPDAMQDIHNPAWGPLNTSHYWGEPLFGYYTSDDEYVLRKHAQMLVDAGVDVVIFDNSNAVTYDHARDTLCKVWEQIRREGGKTPQIAFLCPFGNPNYMGSHTLAKLYDALYAPGLYKDLWFYWRGKPLVLADPSYASADGMTQMSTRQPVPLNKGGTLGQTFTAERPFDAAGGEFPTWGATDSGMTLSLYSNGPGGKLLARQKFSHPRDNAAALVESPKPLPPGKYYLEMSKPSGHIGWWGFDKNIYPGGNGFENGAPSGGDFSLDVKYKGEAENTALVHDAPPLTPAEAAARAQKIRDFFTFRSPIAIYNDTSPKPDHWAWLQIAPQTPQRDSSGAVEQVTVGVAQNWNAKTHLAPMSFPGAFGRSYHNGRTDTRPNAVDYGLNFAEQWNNALKIDPPFVFVTGWNEWTAGFYQSWAGYNAPPPIFVDEFDEEYSRDIEPMTGGHGDDYYYQLADYARRYKGVRPLPKVVAAPIKIDGAFAAWKKVSPEFRDDIGDTAHRDEAGVGSAGPYINNTGRNDIVASKVSYDAHNIYFYVRTRAKLSPHTNPNWMLLYLNVDGNYKTGWLGYDFMINRKVGAKTTSLERNIGGKYSWSPVKSVDYRVSGNEMMIAIPRSALGIKSLPATIDFKWADNCYQKGDWTDFTLNGDAAPNDRFNYRAVLGGK